MFGTFIFCNANGKKTFFIDLTILKHSKEER